MSVLIVKQGVIRNTSINICRNYFWRFSEDHMVSLVSNQGLPYTRQISTHSAIYSIPSSLLFNILSEVLTIAIMEGKEIKGIYTGKEKAQVVCWSHLQIT